MPAKSVSRETPSQVVPSFDQRVTQCKSTVTVSLGKARNAFQSHRRKTSAPSSIANSHCSSGTRGVGPAESTGKSVVRYCPGGSFTSAALRRPEKPRETIAIIQFSSTVLLCNPFCNRGLFCLDQRHVDQMLAQEPNLEFTGAQHFANEQVVGALIAQSGGAARQFPGLPNDDLVRIQQARELNRNLLPTARRAFNLCGFGDIRRHRQAHPAK